VIQKFKPTKKNDTKNRGDPHKRRTGNKPTGYLPKSHFQGSEKRNYVNPYHIEKEPRTYKEAATTTGTAAN
jgi:hypothetical protein